MQKNQAKNGDEFQFALKKWLTAKNKAKKLTEWWITIESNFPTKCQLTTFPMFFISDFLRNTFLCED